MIKQTLTVAGLMALSSPALAAKVPSFSFANTDFVVLLAFIIFLGILVYFKVPGMLSKMLDDRSRAFSRNWTKRAPCAKRRRPFWPQL